MLAPEFWITGGKPWPLLLAPMGWVYSTTGKIERLLTRPHRAVIPIICVGNLTAGGTGKTPIALSLARLLAENGITPGFLTHGYGGTARGPLAIDPASHDAALVGDEALLLATTASTWVAKKRRAGILSMIDAGIECAILDDGHQDPSLVKDISLVVVDGETGFGNERCIPAGPLRETVSAGIARADAIIVMGADRAEVRKLVTHIHPELPVLAAHLVPSAAAAGLKGRRVFAFAGIGQPEKFRATLLQIGANIQEFQAFPDHYPYSDDDITRLLVTAKAADAMAVTTAKDRMRLSTKLRAEVTAIEVTAVFDDPAAIWTLMASALSPWAAPKGLDQGA